MESVKPRFAVEAHLADLCAQEQEEEGSQAASETAPEEPAPPLLPTALSETQCEQLAAANAECDLQTPLAKSGGICFISASARIASQTLFESLFRLRPRLHLPKHV